MRQAIDTGDAPPPQQQNLRVPQAPGRSAPPPPAPGPGALRPAGSRATQRAGAAGPLLALSAALLLAACHQRVQRPAGDELPYPPLDAAAMDRTASPCQDFYQYACGRWIAETPTPPDRSLWVRGAGEQEERNLRLLRRILEDARAGKVEAHERFGRKVGDFYAACMDESDVEARASAELQAEWARLDAAEGREELVREVARLAAMGVAVPFGLRAAADPTDPHRAVLWVEATGLGPLAPEAWRSDDASAVAARAAFADHVRAELRLGGVAAAQLDAAVSGALAIETALASARDAAPAASPPRLDRSGLEGLAPGYPWGPILAALDAGRRIALAVAEPGLAAEAGRLFEEAPPEQWRAWLRWRIADHMTAAAATTSAMVEERHRYRATLAPAAPELRPRWKLCVDLTGRIFDLAAGTAFARRHLGPAGRAAAADLVSRVEAGLRAGLEGAPWMDTATEVRAGHQLERLQVAVGYPDVGGDYERLRVGREGYFRNVLSAGRYAVAAEVARADRPVDRAEWRIGPFAAAPAYVADRNALFVPAGALQPPLYDRDAPEAVRLGALGTRVGRALAESIQGEGRWHGVEGERATWWTSDAATRFGSTVACLAEQYQAYRTAPGGAPARSAPGEDPAADVLGEMAGLRAALNALRAAQAQRPGGRVMGFGPEQQLFVAYAQSLCTARGGAGGAADDLAARFRVNGALSNLPDFGKAFRCGEGTPMARPAGARCAAW